MKKQIVAAMLLIGLSSGTLFPNVKRHVHCLFKPSKPQQCSKEEIQAGRVWLGRNSLKALGALLLAAGATATTIFAVKQLKKQYQQYQELSEELREDIPPFVGTMLKRRFEQEQKEKKQQQKQEREKMRRQMDPHLMLKESIKIIIKKHMGRDVTAKVTIEGSEAKIMMETKEMPSAIAQDLINLINTLNADITKLRVGSVWQSEEKEYIPSF